MCRVKGTTGLVPSGGGALPRPLPRPFPRPLPSSRPLLGFRLSPQSLALSLLGFSFCLLYSRTTAVFGFRAHPKPSMASFETCSLITSAKTLCPIEVTFAGAGVDSDIRCWGHGSTRCSTVLDLGSAGSCMSAWGGHQVLGGSGSAWGSPGWSLPSSARSRAGVLGTCLAQRLHPLPRPGVTPGSVPVQAGASKCETGWRGQVAVPQPGRLRAAGTGLWGRGLPSCRAHYSSASP